MNVAANIVVGLIAALHVYIMVLEMFFWTTPRALRAFGMQPDLAARTTAMAANQGLYNGFLAAGLIWGIVAGGSLGHAVKLFFSACVLVAGVYGCLTVSRKIIFVQTVPAAIGIALVLLAG